MPITVDDVIFSQRAAARPRAAQSPLLLQEGRQGGADRRAQGAIHVRSQRRPRDAADHGIDAGAAEASHRSRHVRDDLARLPSAAGLTPSTRSIPARRSPSSAIRTIGAATSRSIAGAIISTRSASTITGTPAACSKRSSRGWSSLRERGRSDALDGRLRLPRAPRRTRGQGGAAARDAGRHVGARRSTRGVPLFADQRVREALIKLFDFEWVNRTLYHGQYARTESYFARSDLSSHGHPADATERALLAPYLARGQACHHGRQLSPCPRATAPARIARGGARLFSCWSRRATN